MKTGLLAKLSQGKDERPEGWKTLYELMSEDPMPETTARELINDAVAAGVVETKKFKSPIGNGKFALRINYREKIN